MLSNPFSEEDAQRYLDEFTSWPHTFSPLELVYAGFRSAANTTSPDNVICYGCKLEIGDWSEENDPLSAHLEDSADCPIALAIEKNQEDTEEEIKQHTLALITKQKKIREENAKNALAIISQQTGLPSIEKEARLLQFYRGKHDKGKDGAWELSNVGGKGMPVDAPLQQTSTESTILTETYDADLMAAIAEALGEGGHMDGWVVNSISEVETEGMGYKERLKVNVLVVKGKINVAKNHEAIGEWIPTPGTSVTEGH
ncbi:MAG: hypothetical protein Q9209_003671 [Squamulea sp. 1 TL-2023]